MFYLDDQTTQRTFKAGASKSRAPDFQKVSVSVDLENAFNDIATDIAALRVSKVDVRD